jgi:PTS system, lactose/cellobiose family IIC component
MALQNILEEKMLPKIMDFVSTKTVQAIRDGFSATIGLTIIGSIFLLIANFPYSPFVEFLTKTGWRSYLLQANNATYSILALASVFTIGYYYAKNEKIEALNAGILSLVAFVVLINHFHILPNNEKIDGVIPVLYLGSRGMIASIIIGVTVGKVYSWFIKNKIVIKMPDGVPSGVANSFVGLIPGTVIVTGSVLLYALFNIIFKTTFVDFIYKVLSIPLQGMTSTFGGAIIMAFAMSFLWWFGVHGASIVSGIMAGILMSNMLENQEILDAGKILTTANGYIVTYNFRTMLQIITGSGITIGIVVYMLFFAKSRQFKELGKLSIGAAIFNINEPIIFGTPVVMNPILFIPFIGVPIVATVVAYISMKTGLVPLMGNVNPPWTTPPIISGFLVGGWRLALLQAVIMLISILGYFPFIKKQDQINYEQEQTISEAKE